MEAGLVGVSKNILRNFLHEDNTKTSVAAPEATFALEFDHNGGESTRGFDYPRMSIVREVRE